MALLNKFLLVTLVAIYRLVATVEITLNPTDHSQLSAFRNRLSTERAELEEASVDFGRLGRAEPIAVFHPSSAHDVAEFVRSVTSGPGFPVSARGHGHSINGQAHTEDGVVVEMGRRGGNGPSGPKVDVEGKYVDVWGGELWVDVLKSTLEYGLAPRSWTDYLYLTVGGTLSNAGISGQAFNYGPQISNVHELDVVTGKGEIMTCSEDINPELFHAVLGGLGQFGIITRARIALETSPQREIDALLKTLDFIPATTFTTDLPYVDFLDRVHRAELKLRSKGLWEVPHPWLNLFVPKSRISDFNEGVFKGILGNKTSGPILIYPMNKHKWDNMTSVVTPNEEVFYLVALLRTALENGEETQSLEYLTEQNQKILKFCKDAKIGIKQYLPHYTSEIEWMDHFGDKWDHFYKMKMEFDPKKILATGQRIFKPVFDTSDVSFR